MPSNARIFPSFPRRIPGLPRCGGLVRRRARPLSVPAGELCRTQSDPLAHDSEVLSNCGICGDTGDN